MEFFRIIAGTYLVAALIVLSKSINNKRK